MKKAIVIYLIVVIVAIQVSSLYSGKNVSANEQKVIPKEAIRLRILANSDLPGDQALKHRVRDEVNASITNWVKDVTEIETGRKIIQSHLPEIEKIIAKTLKEAGSNQTFTVEFRKNVQFPTKLYGNFLYPAGDYEAILITLGDGEGENWWCVLFPPLCFLDFSNGEAIKTPESSTEEKKEETDEKIIEPVNVFERTKEEVSIEEKLNKAIVKEVKKPKEKDKVEVRFFLKDLYNSLFN
ncbi:MAG: stage II sporulation protein R [Bacillaceae bacterium]